MLLLLCFDDIFICCVIYGSEIFCFAKFKELFGLVVEAVEKLFSEISECCCWHHRKKSSHSQRSYHLTRFSSSLNNCVFVFHLSSRYLKEFRVDQCPLFLQHKCQQHRPFTCFHWHFQNQRRRRPIRRRDGTFNYSADVYCSKYDETTGICPDGDE